MIKKSCIVLLFISILTPTLDAVSWFRRAHERAKRASQYATGKYYGLSRAKRYAVNAALIGGAAAMLIAAIRYKNPELYLEYKEQFSKLPRETWNAVQKRFNALLSYISMPSFDPNNSNDLKLASDLAEIHSKNPAAFKEMEKAFEGPFHGPGVKPYMKRAFEFAKTLKKIPDITTEVVIAPPIMPVIGEVVTAPTISSTQSMAEFNRKHDVLLSQIIDEKKKLAGLQSRWHRLTPPLKKMEKELINSINSLAAKIKALYAQYGIKK